MLEMPLAVSLILRFSPVESDIAASTVLMATMPAATLAPHVIEVDGDGDHARSLSAAAIALAAVTLP